MHPEGKLLNTGEIKVLTSAGHPHYHPLRLMENEVQTAKRKDSRKASYPLRFRTKTQKERMERAARKSGKSLREFILAHAEMAADSILGEKAS